MRKMLVDLNKLPGAWDCGCWVRLEVWQALVELRVRYFDTVQVASLADVDVQRHDGYAIPGQ